MANIGDKIKPFVTPDWSQMDGRSKPFYQPATDKYLERYSVTVLSEHTTTGGEAELRKRMDAAKEPGLNRILKYYSKESSDSADQVFAEDFYVSERPNAKMKILVSFPCDALKGLPDKILAPPTTNAPAHEIKLNSFSIQNKIDLANKFILKYGAEIKKFQGRVYGFDHTKESKKLLGLMPAIIQLLQANDIIFTDSESDLITFFTTHQYEVIYGRINRGAGSIPLSKGWDNFVDNPSIKHKRAIKLLSKLDEVQETFQKAQNISWTKFFEEFIYNPPQYDFSTPRPQSPDRVPEVDKKLQKDNDNPIKTQERLSLFQGFIKENPTAHKTLVDYSVGASEFIGDSIIGNLDVVGAAASDVSAVFKDVLNSTGLDGILKAALDCLDVKTDLGFGDITTASEDLLNNLNQMFMQVEGGLPHNIPTMSFPDDFPIVNLLKDIGMNLLKTIVGAIVGALIALVLELIKIMFTFCTECSIRTEDGTIKKYNKLNYGAGTGISFGDFVGDEISRRGGRLFIGATLNALGTSEWTGEVESFSQEVLKNSVNNIDNLYEHEARRIFNILETGVAGENASFGSQWNPLQTATSQAQNTLAFQFGSTPEELKKSGFTQDMTLDQVRTAVRRKSPWSAEVFQEASKQLSDYMDAIMTSWTPGEIGNGLLGCGVSSEAKEVARNALPNYPELNLVFGGADDDETDDNLADVWAMIGNMIGQEPVLKAIADLAGNVPEEYKCLDELDYTDLREKLLAQKDPDLDADQIADQVAKAKERNRNRIQEMMDLMGRDDIFKGKMPPLFCSASADGTIVPGVLPVSHPTTVFAMKRALDTTYDSLKMTFNSDVRGWIPALSIRTHESVPIARTETINASGDRVFTPEFKSMISNGLVTYGSLPYGSKIPKSKTPPDVLGPNHDRTSDEAVGEEILYNSFLALFSDDWANPAGAGMWDEGQTEPTPDQEYEWEKHNVRISAGNGGIKLGGGRTWEVAPPPTRSIGSYIYGKTWDGKPVRIVDYTRTFGYSPIPVHQQKEGAANFVPGIEKSYQNMCDENADVFSITKETTNETAYSFEVPNNIIKDSGIDLQKISEGMASIGGEMGERLPGIMTKVGQSLNAIAGSAFTIQYVVPPDNGLSATEIQKDEYYLNFSIEAPGAPQSGLDALETQTFSLAGSRDIVELPNGVKRVIEDDGLQVIRQPSVGAPVQPQTGYFYDYSKKVWERGGTTRRDGITIKNNNSIGLMKNYWFNDEKLARLLYSKDAYKNLYKDLFCSFANQIAESPYLKLQDSESGKGLLSVNLAPAKVHGVKDSCQKTLLDVDIIKEQIIREQDLLECINQHWRSEENMASNTNSPYQIASRAGCILLTIRSYVLEYILKFIYSFYYFTPSTPEDVDQTSVYYIYNRVDQEIAARGFGTTYYFEFQKEAIELYNRNKPTAEHLSFEVESNGQRYVNFRKALDALIRYQVFSVSRRLSRDFVELRGDVDAGDPHSILLQEWLPTIEPPTGSGELRFTNPDGSNKELKSFNEAMQIPEVSMDMILATQPGGTLSEEGIRRMSGDSAYGSTPQLPFGGDWKRITHTAPLGKIFREYFTPNKEMRRFKDYTSTESYNTAEELWPGHGYAAAHIAKDSQGKSTWARQPVMGGMARENAILNIPSRVGEDYRWGGGLDRPPRSINMGWNKYSVGVSNAEKEATNKITQFLYAATSWAVPQDKYKAFWHSIPARLNLETGGAYDFEQEAANYKVRPHGGRETDDFQKHRFTILGVDLDPWTRIPSGESRAPIAEGSAPRTKPLEWPNGRPFWALKMETAGINKGLSGREDAEHDSWAMRAMTENYGPGSLLRWITQKKVINPYVESTKSFSARPHLGHHQDVTFTYFQSRFDGGFNWECGEKLLDCYKVMGVNQTSLEAFHSANKRICYRSAWINPFSEGATTWNPGHSDPNTIGMPELPEASLRKLGIKAAADAGTPRSTNLLFYLLPESHHRGHSQFGPGYGGRRTWWYRNVEEALSMVKGGQTQYLSLLDLHPDAVRRALIWEQGMYKWMGDFLLASITTLSPESTFWVYRNFFPNAPRGVDPQQYFEKEAAFYYYMSGRYDQWIRDWEEVMSNFESGESQRRCLKEPIEALVNSGKIARNDLLTPPMYDIEGGNLILEPYIRVMDYTGAEATANGIGENVDWIKGNTLTGKTQVVRNEFTEGVVNIDWWDKFMRESFQNFPEQKTTDEIIPATPSDEDCGDGLPSRREQMAPREGRVDLPQLKDYFKNLYYGIRIMYLPDPGLSSEINDPNNRRDGDAYIKHEKAFFIEEDLPSGETRSYHPYPLASIELSVDMMTTINAAKSTYPAPASEDNLSILESNCSNNAPPPSPPGTIGYFRHEFNKATPGERFSSPRDQLQRGLIQMDEYKFLFKYCFPLERMLSMLNIYSATYMSSLPNASRVFEPTKEELMGIFMRSLRSGDWQNACKTGNIDVMDAIMNGLQFPMAAVLQMALKWPMLIFKGFMEQADINIAITKNIQNAIKAMNSTIAAIQTNLNAAQQAGAGMISSIEQATNIGITQEACGLGIQTPDPRKPPDNWFDPVEQNLIYVPETWMIGLALLPSTIFAPFLWGPPINIPFGLAYWALDDSHVNWLNAFPDFPHDLWARKDKLLNDAITGECPPDFETNGIFTNTGNGENNE